MKRNFIEYVLSIHLGDGRFKVPKQNLYFFGCIDKQNSYRFKASDLAKVAERLTAIAGSRSYVFYANVLIGV